MGALQIVLANDTSDELRAWAFVVFAIAALIFVVVMAPFMLRRLRHLSVDIGKIKVDMDSVKKDVTEEIKPRVISTNHTTNHREVGDPTIVQQIRTVDQKVDNVGKKIDKHIERTDSWHALVIAKLGITIEEQELNEKASVLRRTR